MCAIIGIEKLLVSEEEVKKGFLRLTKRGPDGERYLKIDEAFLGFKRLSIMGLDESGMQPFEDENYVIICNGEIYGYEKFKEEFIKEGYEFKSNSDCEILLPLYHKYGEEMFKLLDSEFALIIYDKKEKKLIAARDPIGIRPLFYGEGSDHSLVFASEVKAIIDIATNIKPFPPSYYYKDGKFTRYNDLTSVKAMHFDIDDILKNIKDLLIKGVKKRLVSDAKVGFLLSGGLDSSLVCSIASKLMDKPIVTFAIGMENDAIDLKYAREVAEYLHSEHHEIIISKDDVLKALEEVIYTLETYDITTIRASMGMYLICKKIHETSDIKVLLTGEISDELFGYKYTDYAPNSEEFQREAKKRIDEIYMYDVLRADRCISSWSLEARVPFGDLEFVKYVMEIDPKLKMNTYNKGKYLLRKAFEGDFLPNNILYREKAAFSDAVGHSLVDYLKAYANEYYSDEDFITLKEKYSFATPFTKESLLYREIFEKYYPNLASLVKDFWMPNKDWEGCNVDDPSARVLKNYGDSAK